jgi:hypothetical protein
MKTTKTQPIARGRSDVARQLEVQQEIENFLNALESYPDRFARDPYLSFEQHLYSVAAENHSVTDRRRGYAR